MRKTTTLTKNLARRLLRGWREERGDAIIEVAAVVAFLCPPLLIGTTEMASVVYASIEVSNAAHAGALYAMQSSANATNTSAITTAAQNEAADYGTSLTVTPTTYYACSSAEDGTQYATQSLATTGCTGTGNHGLLFASVKVSAPITPPFHFSALLQTYTVVNTSVMEVEQ